MLSNLTERQRELPAGCTAATKARCENQGVSEHEVNALEAKETEIDASEHSISASST